MKQDSPLHQMEEELRKNVLTQLQTENGWYNGRGGSGLNSTSNYGAGD